MIAAGETGLVLLRGGVAAGFTGAGEEVRHLGGNPLIARRRHADQFNREALIDADIDSFTRLPGGDAHGDIIRRRRRQS
jgi:hypothetical protein